MAKNAAAQKTGQGIIVCKGPDVCKTPIGSATPPIPYFIVAKLDLHKKASKNVKMNGNAVLKKDSYATTVIGDEPGVAKGIKHSSHKGKCVPYQKLSPTVYINNQPLVTHTTDYWMNCSSSNGSGNTLGSVVFIQATPLGKFDPTGGVPEGNPAAELTEEEEGWFSRAAAMIKSGAEATWDGAKSINSEYKVLTRGVGLVQGVGGGIEAVVGAVGVVAPEPVTSVGGAVLVVHGADNFQAGFRTLWTGEFTDTALEAGAGIVADSVGANPETVKGIIGMVGPPSQMAKGAVKEGVESAANAGAKKATKSKSGGKAASNTGKGGGKNKGDGKKSKPDPCKALESGTPGAKYKGGKHGKMAPGGKLRGTESHHMPADSVNGMPKSQGPSIQMDKADHLNTASHDNKPGAAVHRATQKGLIESGGKAGFLAAMMMDVADIRGKFGDKYDSAIAQMIAYAKCKKFI